MATANEKARQSACDWGIAIAKDNSFHYGRTSWAHHSGCYFCGTNGKGSAKHKAGGSLSAIKKTYCCNPFVTACYHHGAGAPSIDCKKPSKRINLANDKNKPFQNTKEWKKIKEPSKVTDLKKGDVLLTPTHCMLHVGDGKIVHAKHHDNGVEDSYWNDSIKVETIPDKQWERTTKIYRYIGKGKFKDDPVKKSYSKARFPMDYLRITATPTSTQAHRNCSLDFPVDLAGKDSGRDWFMNYLGSELVVLRRYTKASHAIWLRTKYPVRIPLKGDTPVYLYMMIEHQDNSEMKGVGSTYGKLSKVVREGHNSGSGKVGDHLHVSFGYSTTKVTSKTCGTCWRKAPKGGWSMSIPHVKNIKIEQAVYVDKRYTEVLDTKGIKFKEI